MADDGGRKVKNESVGAKTSDEENVTSLSYNSARAYINHTHISHALTASACII